jgi:NAD(P)H-flavin reductase
VVAIWFHLWYAPYFPRLVIYVFSAIFLSMLVVHSLHILYRNKAMGRDLCRAYIACTGDAIKIRLVLSRHVKVEAGQYVGLCIPAAGLCAFQQSHPFTVVSWSEGKQKHLDFLLQSRNGITRSLFKLGKANRELRSEDEAGNYMVIRNLQPHLAWFSGPYGPIVSVANYETILMIASDFGIVSQLPYLIKLIYGYKNRKTHNRRIHLVWHLKSGSKS